MVFHDPQQRMGRYVHFSALAPVWTGPMCVIAHISEVPRAGKRAKEVRGPSTLSDWGNANFSKLRKAEVRRILLLRGWVGWVNRGEPPSSAHRCLAAVRYTVCQATPKATAKAASRDRGRHHEHGHEDGHALACPARCQQPLSRKESAMNTADSRPPRVPPPWFVHTA